MSGFEEQWAISRSKAQTTVVVPFGAIFLHLFSKIWLLSMRRLLGNHSCRHSSPSVSANNSEVDENPAMISYRANQKTIYCNKDEE